MENEVRLGLGDRIAIAGFVGGFAGTVAAMALPPAYPDMPVWVWRLIFWPSVALLVGAVAYLIFDLLIRPKGFAFRTPSTWQKAAIAILVGSGVLWFDYWYYSNVLNALAVVVNPQPPKLPPPPEPPKPSAKKIEATWSKAFYKCKTTDVAPVKKAKEKQTADFQQYMRVYAEIIAYSVAFPTILGGDKAELVAPKKTDLITKMTFETRRLGRDFLGIFTAEFNSNPYDIYSSQPMVPDSDFEAKIRKRIEDLAGVAKGDCELQ